MAKVVMPSSNGSQINHWIFCRAFIVRWKCWIYRWSMFGHFNRLQTMWFTPRSSLGENCLKLIVGLTILDTPGNNSSMPQLGAYFYIVLSGMDLVSSAFARSGTYTLYILKSQISGNMASMFVRVYSCFHVKCSLF